mgnify:CR=1 FL=1
MASKMKGGIKKVVEKVIHGPLRTNIPAGRASSAAPLGQQLGQVCDKICIILLIYLH